MYENCQFDTKDKFEIKGHLALMHSFEELALWGFRKDLLLKMYRAYINDKS